MEVPADPWPIRHDVKDVVPEIPWIAGEEPDPSELRHLVMDPSEEFGEGRDTGILNDLVPERGKSRSDLRSLPAVLANRLPMLMNLLSGPLPTYF